MDNSSETWLKKYIKEHPRDYKPINVSFGCDWDSFIFWRPMNWRNFTFIEFYIETNDYSRYLELRIALLGFHFSLDWWRKHDKEGIR